jgi:phosphoglycerate dehydrogenase-like enzyme
VQITPHIASLTYPKESVLQMMDCLEKIEKDLPLTQEVSREKMY